jgi:hypothetical protein
MKRLRHWRFDFAHHWLFNFAAVVSLLLLGGTVIAWPLSYWRKPAVQRMDYSGSIAAVFAERGTLQFRRS